MERTAEALVRAYSDPPRRPKADADSLRAVAQWLDRCDAVCPGGVPGSKGEPLIQDDLRRIAVDLDNIPEKIIGAISLLLLLEEGRNDEWSRAYTYAMREAIATVRKCQQGER